MPLNYYNTNADESEWEDIEPSVTPITMETGEEEEWEDIEPSVMPITMETGEEEEWEDIESPFETGVKEPAYKTILSAIRRTPKEMAAAGLSAIRGGDIDVGEEEGWSGRFIEKQQEETRKAIERASDKGIKIPVIGKITAKDIASLPSNLGFSGVSALTGLAVGVPLVLTPEPTMATKAAAWSAGTAASGAVAYRMAKDQFVNELFDVLNQQSISDRGTELTQEEWGKIREDYDSKATKYGLYEAIPEALGNAATLGIIRLPVGSLLKAPGVMGRFANLGANIINKTGVKSPVAKKLLTGAGKLAAMQAEELGTETITQKGQAGIEADIGLREETPTWGEAFKEVAPSVTLLTGVMGGAGALGSYSFDKANKVARGLQETDLVETETEEEQRVKTLNVQNLYRAGRLKGPDLQKLRATLPENHPAVKEIDTILDEIKATTEPIDLGKPVSTPKTIAMERVGRALDNMVRASGLREEPPGGPPPAAPGAVGKEPIEASGKVADLAARALMGEKVSTKGLSKDEIEQYNALIQEKGITPEAEPKPTIPPRFAESVVSRKALSNKKLMDLAGKILINEPVDLKGLTPEEVEQLEYLTKQGGINYAAKIYRNEGQILPGKARGLEQKTPARQYVKGEERPTVRRSPGKVGQNIQLPEKAGAIPGGPEQLKPETDVDKIIQGLIGYSGEVAAKKEEEEKATGLKEIIDEGAAQVETEPTPARAEAGNYKKAHVNVQGLDISIESPKGSTRSGVSPEGRPWKSLLYHHYGYIRRTEGKDGDQVDVFLGDKPESRNVYVVNQVNPETGKFDEHKAMIGFESPGKAYKGYLSNYQRGWKGMGSIIEMSMDEFKTWLKEGDQTKEAVSPKKPVAREAKAKEPESVYKEIRQNEGIEAEKLIRGLNSKNIGTVDTHVRDNNIIVQIYGDEINLDRLSDLGLNVIKRQPVKGISESWNIKVPIERVDGLLKELQSESVLKDYPELKKEAPERPVTETEFVKGNLFKQLNKESCGKAVTQSVLKMYGKDTDITIKTEDPTSPKKITMLLNEQGIETEPKEITFDSLKPQSIAYYPDSDHYVTIEETEGNRVLINDSLKDKTEWLSKEAFEKKWLKDNKGWVLETHIPKPLEEVRGEAEIKGRESEAERRKRAGTAKTFRDWVRLSGGVNPNDSTWKGELNDLRWELDTSTGKKTLDKGLGYGFFNKSARGIDERVTDAIDAGWLAPGSTEQDFIDAIEKNITEKWRDLARGDFELPEEEQLDIETTTGYYKDREDYLDDYPEEELERLAQEEFAICQRDIRAKAESYSVTPEELTEILNPLPTLEKSEEVTQKIVGDKGRRLLKHKDGTIYRSEAIQHYMMLEEFNLDADDIVDRGTVNDDGDFIWYEDTPASKDAGLGQIKLEIPPAGQATFLKPEEKPFALTPTEPTPEEEIAIRTARGEKKPIPKSGIRPVIPTEPIPTGTGGKQEGLFGPPETKKGETGDLFEQKKAEAPEGLQRDDGAYMGQNLNDNPVYEDKDGNRFFVNKEGEKITAPRRMGPTGEKMPPYTVEQLKASGRAAYLTKEEFEYKEPEKETEKPNPEDVKPFDNWRIKIISARDYARRLGIQERIGKEGWVDLDKIVKAIDNYLLTKVRGYVIPKAEKAVEIPDIKSTGDAFNFSKTATPEQLERVKALAAEYDKKATEAREANDFDEGIKQATNAQLMREVLRAKEHPEEFERQMGGKPKAVAGEAKAKEPLKSEFKVKPPLKLYRGEFKQPDGSIGLGTFNLGKGIYSTFTKDFAEKYGKVTELTPKEAFPRNPLELQPHGDPKGAFSDWVLKNSYFKNIREFNKTYPDPGTFVKEKGYDGVIIGDEIVYYPELKKERKTLEEVRGEAEIKGREAKAPEEKIKPEIKEESAKQPPTEAPEKPIEPPALTPERAEATSKREEAGWETGNLNRPFAFDPNSTENEGRFRLQSPELFQKDTYFRRKSSIDGISYLLAKKKDTGKTEFQTIRFDKGKITETEAAEWWEKNKERIGEKIIKPEKVEIPKKEGVGTVRLDKGGVKPFTSWKEITKGPKKGRIEVALSNGKKIIVKREQVRTWPGEKKPYKDQILNEGIDKIGESDIQYAYVPTDNTQLQFNFTPAEQQETGAVQTTQRVRMDTTGYIKGAGNIISGPGDVASLLASIRKSPQEYLYTVTIDKNGVILEIHKYAKGVKYGSYVLPSEIVGRVLNIKDASKTYLVHNHPTGDAIPSAEDSKLGSQVEDLLKAGDIELQSLIIGKDEYVTYPNYNLTDIASQPKKIPAVLRKILLPVKERKQLIRTGKSRHAGQSYGAIAILNEDFQNQDGVLLLDRKNDVVAFVPFIKGRSMKDTTADIIRFSESTNASTYIVNNNVDTENRQAYLTALKRGIGDLLPLDIIDYGKSLADEGRIAEARRHYPEADYETLVSGKPVYSLEALTPAQLERIASIKYADVKKAFPGSKVYPVRLNFKDAKGGYGYLITLPSGIKIVIDPTRDKIVFDPDKIARDYKISKERLEQLLKQEGYGAVAKYRGIGEYGLIEMLAISGPSTLSHEKFHALFDLALDRRDRINILKRYGTEEKAADAFRRREGFTRSFWEKIKRFIDNLRSALFGDVFKPVFEALEGEQVRKEGEAAGEAYAMAQGEPLNTDSEAFKKWFKGSKVVDEKGKPQIMYHGTPTGGFDIFKEYQFFTSNKERADIYQSTTASSRNFNRPLKKQQTYAVYLKIEKPFDTRKNQRAKEIFEEFIDPNRNDTGWYSYAQRLTAKGLPDWMELDSLVNFMTEKGYINKFDGFILDEGGTGGYDQPVYDRGISYVPKNSTQIKSIFNRGTWNPEDERISYSMERLPDYQKKAEDWITSVLGEGKIDNTPRGREIKRNFVMQQVTANEPTFADGFVIGNDSALRQAFDTVQFHIQDRMNSLSRVQKAIETTRGEELEDQANAVQAEEAMHGAAMAKIQDFNRDLVEPLIDKIHDSGLSLEEVEQYVYARHAPESNARLQKLNPKRKGNDWLSGMKNEDALKIVQKYKGNQDMKDIAKMVDQITAATRKVLRKSRLVPEESLDAWEQAYKYYVPLKRQGKPQNMPKRGRGMDIRGKEVHPRLAGSHAPAGNILTNLISQHEVTLVRAEKAKVGRALLKMAQTNPNKEIWEVDKEEYKPFLKKRNEVDPLTGEAIVLQEVTFGRDPMFRFADNVLVVKDEDAVEHTIAFNTENVHAMRICQAMKNLGGGNGGAVVQLGLAINRFLAFVNTSGSPEFIFSNFVRDVQTAGYNISDTQGKNLRGKMYKDVFRALQGIREGIAGKHGGEWEQWYQRFRKAGAQTGWTSHYKDIDARRQALQSLLDSKNNDPFHTSMRGARMILELISKENTAVENAIRLSLFRHLIEDINISEPKAVSIVKNLTVNFNKKGMAGPAINALYLFFNAGMQGSARLVTALVRSPQVRKLAIGTALFAMLWDIACRMMMGDDDDGEYRYDKIPTWVKERNIIIPNIVAPGDYLKIPMPWGYNVFHVIGQISGETLSHGVGIIKKPYDVTAQGMRLLSAVVSAFNPLGGEGSIAQMISPTVADPYIQWKTNENFAGQPLRPEQQPFDVPKPEYQMYWSSCREASKWLSKRLYDFTNEPGEKPGGVNVSPEAFDLVWDSFTGSLGRTISQTVGTPWGVLTGKTTEAEEIPIVRRFYGQPSEYFTETTYYDNLARIRYAERDLKELEAAGETAEAAKLRQEKRTLINLGPQTDISKRRITRIKEQIDRIKSSKLDLTEKNKQVEAKNQEIEDEMVKVNKLFSQLNNK